MRYVALIWLALLWGGEALASEVPIVIQPADEKPKVTTSNECRPKADAGDDATSTSAAPAFLAPKTNSAIRRKDWRRFVPGTIF